MIRLIALACFCGSLALALAAPVPAPELPQEMKFVIHSGHFEKNNSGLKGDSSYLSILDQPAFDKVFGSVPPLGGKKHNWLPQDAFKTHQVVAVIKRGTSTYAFSMISVASDSKTIIVKFTSKAGDPGAGTAQFATPLILSIPQLKGREIVFIENGKEVAKVK